MKQFKILIIVVVFTLLNSCDGGNSSNEKITGSWIIEELEYKDMNYKDSLNYNMLFFKNVNNNLSVKTPEISIFKQELSSWNIERGDNGLSLKINSSNKIFDGKYNIEFVKDEERKILGAKLKSESTFMLVYKLEQNFSVD